MHPAGFFQQQLLQHTALLSGRLFLQQLVGQLGVLLPEAAIWLGKPAARKSGHIAVLHATPQIRAEHYLLAGTPCATVWQENRPVSIQWSASSHPLFPSQASEGSYLGLPLQSATDGHCMAHLAIFGSQPPDAYTDLVEQLQPFLQRAAAELEQQQQLAEALQRKQWHQLGSDVMRHYLAEASLPGAIKLMIDRLEELIPDWQCSLILLGDDGGMQPVYGPSLPEDYHRQIAGLQPGPEIGSCGAAIWQRQRVIASDLSSHPNWAAFRHLTTQYALGSCWSEPILGSQGKVYGSFAVYHQHPAKPDAEHIAMLEDCANQLALILENHDIRQSLQHKQQWYQALLQNAADALSIIDLDGRFLEASDATLRMLELTAEELSELRLWQVDTLLTEDIARQRLASIGSQSRTFESISRSKSGRMIEVEVSVRRIVLGGKPLIWGSARDIGQRKSMQRILERQATIDALTGLFNRQTLLARLETLLRTSHRQQQPLAVLLLDIDHFKQINDHYGHQAGDLVLSEFGATLQDRLHEQHMAGRLGGEEFCVLLPDCDLESAQDLAMDILDEISGMRIQHGEHTLSLTCSIGVACRETAEDSHHLLSRADKALYAAKNSGRNQVQAAP